MRCHRARAYMVDIFMAFYGKEERQQQLETFQTQFDYRLTIDMCVHTIQFESLWLNPIASSEKHFSFNSAHIFPQGSMKKKYCLRKDFFSLHLMLVCPFPHQTIQQHTCIAYSCVCAQGYTFLVRLSILSGLIKSELK